MEMSSENIEKEVECFGSMPECPETPKEPMEFLARSWSVSALEVSRALAPLMQQQQQQKIADPNDGLKGDEEEAQQWPTFSLGSLHGASCMEGIVCNTLKGKTARRWIKDKKVRRKEEQRAHNAQVHAAMSVGGVATAVAAIAAASAHNQNENEDHQPNTTMAVASAANLVASHCVEMAMSMGAEPSKMASLLNSAANVKTPGDVITLTAGAATALRGAATLQARIARESQANPAIISFDKGSNTSPSPSPSMGPSRDLSDMGFCSQDVLAKGCELLKLTRKGALHWKMVFVYIKNGEVVVKLKSKHMGGTFTKQNKSVVYKVHKELAAWPDRGEREERCHFGIETASGMLQFECGNKRIHQIFTQGIEYLLSLTRSHTP